MTDGIYRWQITNCKWQMADFTKEKTNIYLIQFWPPGPVTMTICLWRLYEAEVSKDEFQVF